MFKLLSKESNIFSVPVYIGFLLLIVLVFNILEFNTLGAFSALITFVGIALGYFCFNAIALNYQTHLPLFLYTFLILGFYPGDLDIGIAVSLLTNSFLLLILTSQDDIIRMKSYLLIGAILSINFLFLPTTWPMIFFVVLHIIATSERIGLNLFRLVFGGILVALSYFSVMYFMDYHDWNEAYFPFIGLKIVNDFKALYPLIPIFALLLYAVFDHFKHYNKKSPTSKFKYTFVLLFTAAQLITIILYMGNEYQYLILLAFPASIILSRMLLFLPKYWMKELGLWLIIACLLIYKFNFYF